MKQQVNFYTERFKPIHDFLSLTNMLLVWLAGIVFILALYSFEAKNASLAKNNWLNAQKMEQSQQQQLQSLQSSFSSRGDAVVLEKTLQDMQANLQQREFVLEQLGLKAEGMRRGVAGLLESLASMSIDGLWLTDIQVNQGQLSVSGLTTDVEKVPQLIQRLQQINSLQDKRFARLEITTNEEFEGLLKFTLQSENQIANLQLEGVSR